jgi:ribosomal protein S18
MRTRLGKSWNDNLDQPLREFFTGARRVVQDDLLGLQAKLQRLVPTVSQAAAAANALTLGDVVNTGKGVAASTQAKVQRIVSGAWNLVLSTSQMTMDVILPPVVDSSIEDKKSGEPGEEDVAPAPLSVGGICGEALKRTKAWALKGWGQVRKLSTEQLKPRVNIDPAAYSERVVTAFYTSIKPAIDGVQENSTMLIEHTKTRVQDARLAGARAITGVRQSIHLPPAVAPVADHIQRRTSTVIRRVRDISTLTRQYILSREIRKIPVDGFHLFFQAPFILLALLRDSEGNSGEGEFRELTQALRALLRSVKEVFIWKNPPPRTDPPSEGIPVVRAQDQERTDPRPSRPRVEEEEEEDDEEEDDAGAAKGK